ncbi:transcriptional regulator [Chryseobacterium sp. MP_3.2]|uniref:transcriptional regulator n=1 Tax=Chryseobacterium sp. MP_3.2 TaxID=3071712 RepID=UPI002E042759|nr:DNA-binding transcriptional regulator GbsR (MarR family) [Chryseobacterium sp. MP_3.2]
MIEIDKQIFREMVSFYGDAFHLPPLAAKIYAYLIFDFERNGVSFDEFVEVFAASKSSVSSNLNLLLNLNIIKDYNKIDERKRTFVMNEKYMKIRFEEIALKMERELAILNKLKDFRKPETVEEREKFCFYCKLFEKNIFTIKESISQL